MHALGFVLNAVAGNLRHSHVWWSFGRLERVFMSPAQHQIHHAVGQDHRNHGTWLAIWDQLGGTWHPATEQPTSYGLTDRNHGDHLVSAWLDPFRAAIGLPPVKDTLGDDYLAPSTAFTSSGGNGDPGSTR